MLLHEAFDATCARTPHKLAIVCGPERLTYAEVDARVEALADLLRARGVVRGDRVALFLESSVEFAVAVHAVLRVGGVFMPVSSLTKDRKLGYVLADAGASALLTHARLGDVWRPALGACSTVHSVVVAGTDATDSEVLPWPLRPATPVTVHPPGTSGTIDQDLAAIIYTSGTTGVPKGVMLSHANMCSAWASVQQYLGLRTDDVIGLALSPSFSYGLYHVLMGLGLGATLVLERAAAFPVKVAETLATERVTVFPGVPTLFSALLGLSAIRAYDWSSLRIVTNAAAALPHAHVRALRELWPTAQVFSMYGMTECMRISYLPPGELDRRPTSVGLGMPNQEVWLVDDAGRRLPPGSTGELVVRGSHVMRGYWRKPVETAERLRPGPIEGERVLHTGDLFRTDADGWLYFVSRADDVIKCRGEKVSPREVEDAIYAMEGVLDCAVVGVPDDRDGLAVKAFVTLKPGAVLRERDVIRHCLARLENFMAPRSVEFVSTLPRTDSGKIRKVDLVAMVATSQAVGSRTGTE